jgi:hypothetical protein
VSQRWYVHKLVDSGGLLTGKGYRYIYNVHSGMVIDVADASTAFTGLVQVPAEAAAKRRTSCGTRLSAALPEPVQKLPCRRDEWLGRPSYRGRLTAGSKQGTRFNVRAAAPTNVSRLVRRNSWRLRVRETSGFHPLVE